MKEYIIKVVDEKDIWGRMPVLEKPKELIRCRYCKNYNKGHCMCGETVYWNVYPDFYCASGKKMNE